MNLVRVKEASELSYVTTAMVYYWVMNNRLAKHPDPKRPRSYLVDLDEVKRLARTSKLDERPSPNLISRKEAADLIYVGDRMICYYVKMGYIKAHYVFGNDKHYLVDRDEVLAQPKLVLHRMKHPDRLEELSRQAKEMPRGPGSFWAKRTVA
jgi:hypothetical protein